MDIFNSIYDAMVWWNKTASGCCTVLAHDFGRIWRVRLDETGVCAYHMYLTEVSPC